MDPRLEIKLQDASPKCATCAHFGGGTAGQCSLFQFHVLDLAVCSSWTERVELEAIADA